MENIKMNRRLFTLLLILLTAITSDIYAESSQNKVSFEIPSNWKLVKSNKSDKRYVGMYYLQGQWADSDRHYSNAMVQYFCVPDSTSITRADFIVADLLKGNNYVLSAQDGPKWKTYLFTNFERKPQSIILHRIGIADGVCLGFTLFFPHIAHEKGDPSYLLTLNESYVVDKKMRGIVGDLSSFKEMVDIFNIFCSKMKISNINHFEADVRIIALPSKFNRVKPKGGK